jgi:cyclopropane-fatty-acyl-phospholipid synthase
MDAVFRLTLGEHPDITCALYDGDYSKTLEQAQRDKHGYILDGLGFCAGMRMLDVGCGWGPLLSAAKKRGGHAVGLTLSSKQAEACRRSGFEVYVRDWKEVTPETFGGFDAVASVGAFEHFCSEEQYLRGEQGAIYERFFALCAELLPARGRLYLQTMMWGRNMPPYETISLAAPKGSSSYVLAVLRKFYPGSFPPFGEEAILRSAAFYFSCVGSSDGRLDYIETMKQWGRVWRLTPRKLLAMAKTLRYALADPDFRYKLESIRGGYNRLCFEREVLGHRRILFEKR